MFIVYMEETLLNITYPSIQGVFDNKENAIKFQKEKQYINPDKVVIIKQIQEKTK